MKSFLKNFLSLFTFFFLLPTSASAHIVNESAIHGHGIDTSFFANPLFALLALAVLFLIGYIIKKTSA
ncbi:MAG TPA: hypothetical protein VLF20_04090 [Patescibacteria group bacterium]|nr:hypothetical protein [Patescibacteria group bacterium]